MRFSCGNAVVKLLMICGWVGGFSAPRAYRRTFRYVCIHSTADLSRILHNPTHTMITRVKSPFSHTFHSTYNYNNLYKENCV